MKWAVVIAFAMALSSCTLDNKGERAKAVKGNGIYMGIQFNEVCYDGIIYVIWAHGLSVKFIVPGTLREPIAATC